jgi:hypothetical protein
MAGIVSWPDWPPAQDAKSQRLIIRVEMISGERIRRGGIIHEALTAAPVLFACPSRLASLRPLPAITPDRLRLRPRLQAGSRAPVRPRQDVDDQPVQRPRCAARRRGPARKPRCLSAP